MGNAVANKKNAELSTDILDDIFETAGEGASFSSDEMAIPFVRLLQPMSPQINKKKPEFIPGSEQGDVFNTVTGQYWPGEEGIKVIPCYQTTEYLEFVPIDLGGGFKGKVPIGDPLINQTRREGMKEILPNGNELIKSDQHFCLVLDDEGSYQPAIIDMKSASLKISRQWKTKISMQKVKNPKTGQLAVPAVFATIWRMYSVEETNDKGTWNNWATEPVGLVPPEDRHLFLAAKDFRDSILAGEVKAAAEPTVNPEGSGNATGAPYKDNEIPF
jgi:hypothetical protein